jgi:hypothetical protein
MGTEGKGSAVSTLHIIANNAPFGGVQFVTIKFIRPFQSARIPFVTPTGKSAAEKNCDNYQILHDELL